MATIYARPLSKEKIRFYAQEVRRFLRLDDYQRINAAKLLDVLSELWKDYGFQYAVLLDSDSRFKPREEAVTDISTGMIYIKESVMYEACHCKSKRALFTICHEIGHFLFHRMLGGMIIARSQRAHRIKIYEDPEWQADTFASEFLMPINAVMCMTPTKIRNAYGVSQKCAETRYKKVQEEIGRLVTNN